eukprot:860012-Pelagomonas_calceolata.AAC.2
MQLPLGAAYSCGLFVVQALCTLPIGRALSLAQTPLITHSLEVWGRQFDSLRTAGSADKLVHAGDRQRGGKAQQSLPLGTDQQDAQPPKRATIPSNSLA